MSSWITIDLAPFGGRHIHALNAPTTRTYSPCRYWLGRWEYWNELTGVWEKCGKQPTHFMYIPEPPKEAPNAQTPSD